MKKYLDGYAEWVAPEAGMFFWCVKLLHSIRLRGSFMFDQRRFKLILTDQSNVNASATEGDSEAIIRTRAVNKGVLALPGNVFLPNGSKTPYVRASFSLNSEEEVFEALRRLRTAVEEARAEL